MKVYIGSDHSGIEAKSKVKEFLNSLGHEIVDVGSNDAESKDDYPIFAEKVGLGVVRDKGRGILICGTGTGMVIAANKIPGVRAAFAFDEYSARMARVDNDSNVLTLRDREFDLEKLPGLVKIWLETDASTEERHKRRIKEIEEIEKKYRK